MRRLDDQSPEPIGPEPLQLAFEPIALPANAGEQVVQRLSLDGNEMRESHDALVAGREAARLARQAGELPRVLFSGIDDDDERELHYESSSSIMSSTMLYASFSASRNCTNVVPGCVSW